MIKLARNIYYKYFPSGNISTYIRFLYLKRAMRGISFSRALDAGCGTGAITRFFADNYPGTSFVGYDIDASRIEQAKASTIVGDSNNTTFHIQNLMEMDESEEYDFRSLRFVLQYVLDQQVRVLC